MPLARRLPTGLKSSRKTDPDQPVTARSQGVRLDDICQHDCYDRHQVGREVPARSHGRGLRGAGFVNLKATTWVAARHVVRVELDPMSVHTVVGDTLVVDSEYREDLASSLNTAIVEDHNRWEQSTYREISGSVTVYK